MTLDCVNILQSEGTVVAAVAAVVAAVVAVAVLLTDKIGKLSGWQGYKVDWTERAIYFFPAIRRYHSLILLSHLNTGGIILSPPTSGSICHSG